MSPDTLMALKVAGPAVLILAAPFLPWAASRWGRRREWIRTAGELGAVASGGYRQLTMMWSGDDGVSMTATATDGQTLSARVSGRLPADIGFRPRGRTSAVLDPIGDPDFASEVVLTGEPVRLLTVLDHATRVMVASAASHGWRLEDGALVLHERGEAHKHAGTRAALTIGTGLGALLAATATQDSAGRLEERAAHDPLPSVRARALIELGPPARARLVELLHVGVLDEVDSRLVASHLARMADDGRVERAELVAAGESLIQSDDPAVRRPGAALLGFLGHQLPSGGLALAAPGVGEGELAIAEEPEGRLSTTDPA